MLLFTLEIKWRWNNWLIDYILMFYVRSRPFHIFINCRWRALTAIEQGGVFIVSYLLYDTGPRPKWSHQKDRSVYRPLRQTSCTDDQFYPGLPHDTDSVAGKIDIHVMRSKVCQKEVCPSHTRNICGIVRKKSQKRNFPRWDFFFTKKC